MKVIYSEAFYNDLDAIIRFIAIDNPMRAVSFGKELRDSCLSIANFPMSYPIVKLKKYKHMRKKYFGQYIIYFTIHNEFVQINSVIHGARLQKL